MTVTIKDIAKKVGVSPSTVSRVANGSTAISEETRQKILEAMEEMKYHPNSLARNFANGSTNTIGLVIDAEEEGTFSNAFFNRSVFAIEAVVQANGYNLLITNNRENKNRTAVKSLVLEHKVDGIILPSSSVTSKLINLLIEEDFPFLVLGEPEIEKDRISWVDINNKAGSELAVKHLVDMGFKKISFLFENLDTVFAKNRLDGFLEALKKESLPCMEEFIKTCNENAGDLEVQLDKMISGQNKPDAFICSNNLIAFQVLKFLKGRKISVPEEVGLITFDNYPFAEYMEPPLTAVDVDTYTLGEQAAANLLNKIKRTDSGNRQTVISTRLILRQSSQRR
ncbi:LacI family DNA-binding transcriptional regulator [Anaerocolumna sp. AGMB13025]|uniref:LacI family DNA-binding transcriptional regulator n=1 Tax=Anaerocolumna sp. AGMB13025 TaxID=3039116 RepID=UPI00241E1104|nr:LacI family DNA-binding transcriptional regulator [Anaerocolumna sp. AGMB13025]WFR58973.1 LacI family DNA-binding transcriptional regulator [Anaerocolumna sp. AGMB13025]